MSLSVGDTGPIFTATLTQTDPVTRVTTPANLTGSTAKATFTRRQDRSVLGPVTLDFVDAPNGKVSYAWQVGDVSVPGEWDVVVKVTFSGAIGPETFGPATFPVSP